MMRPRIYDELGNINNKNFDKLREIVLSMQKLAKRMRKLNFDIKDSQQWFEAEAGLQIMMETVLYVDRHGESRKK